MVPMMRLSSKLAFAAAVAVLAAAGPAYAGNEAAAEALFVEAKKLAAQGKYAEACPKFAESNRLDRGAGTLIHLGDCYEKNKQTASAWATYKEAASAAQALGRKDWEKLANQRANALEPRMAHITIKVDAPVDKLEVTRDGDPVSRASWGTPIPVDVGSHAVEAKATGFKTFTTTGTVVKDGQNIDVLVPKLEAEPASASSPPATAPAPATASVSTTTPPDADRGSGSGQRTVGFVVAGLGVAGVAVGAITGLMAMGKSSDAKQSCPSDGGCANQSAVDASDSAKTLGLVSTISFAAGGAALVAGAVLIFTAPKGEKKAIPTMRLAPHVGANDAGVTVLGVF
jgi:hypothetical protein